MSQFNLQDHRNALKSCSNVETEIFCNLRAYCHEYFCIATLYEHTFWTPFSCKLTSEHDDFERHFVSLIHEYKKVKLLFFIIIKIWPCSHAAKTKPINRMRIRLLRVNWPPGHSIILIYTNRLWQFFRYAISWWVSNLLYRVSLVWKALKSRVILTAHSRNDMKCLNDAKELGRV